MFYEQEAFKSNDVFSDQMAAVVGKAWVLHIKDFIIYTVKGVGRDNLFLYESKYTTFGLLSLPLV